MCWTIANHLQMYIGYAGSIHESRRDSSLTVGWVAYLWPSYLNNENWAVRGSVNRLAIRHVFDRKSLAVTNSQNKAYIIPKYFKEPEISYVSLYFKSRYWIPVRIPFPLLSVKAAVNWKPVVWAPSGSAAKLQAKSTFLCILNESQYGELSCS